MKLRFLVATGVAAAVLGLSCGGSTTTIGSGDGGGSDGSGGSSGASSSSGGSGGSSGGNSASSSGGAGSSGSSSGMGANCNELLMKVDQLRTGARQCCPACDHAPCQYTVQDFCCPLTVDSQSSQNVIAFENAYNAARAAGCGVACPGIPCQPAPSMMCDAQTSLCAP